MLKLFSQFWLILSLMIAPLPYAMADMAMAEQGAMKCENTDHQSMQTAQSVDSSDIQQQDKCECCDQCGSTCSSCIHFSIGLSQIDSIPAQLQYDSYQHQTVDTVAGLSRLTEFRPPRQLHA